MSLFILDLFSGTGSSTQAFKDAGHRVLHVELDPQHDADWHRDVSTIIPDEVLAWGGGHRPDFIWASPPCTTFSIASVSHHWRKEGEELVPKHPGAAKALELVAATLRLIHDLAPSFWLMENPRGMLRKFPLMAPYPRRTVTYCQYGDKRMKPTDLWGPMPSTWRPLPPCKNGAPCHEAAPRGAKTGTQGLSGSVMRSRVPYGLSLDVRHAIESALLGDEYAQL
jgi:hypothetical protein